MHRRGSQDDAALVRANRIAELLKELREEGFDVVATRVSGMNATLHDAINAAEELAEENFREGQESLIELAEEILRSVEEEEEE